MTRKEEIEEEADKRYMHSVNGHSTFIAGATWADEHPRKGIVDIEKVCEWLKSYRQDTYDGTGYIAGIVNDKTIEDLRKALEE